MPSTIRSACVFDLDGTLNHADPVTGGIPIRGRTTNSFLAPETMEKLAVISRQADIIIATGRAQSTVYDFKHHFAKAGLRITGWILEHGALIPAIPEWREKVCCGIDMDTVRQEIEAMIREYGFPIDYERYRNDHQSVILLSGSGPVMAEHFIASTAVIDNRFRTIAGKRKIALIPKAGEKYNAFNANFSGTHTLSFAAGDQPDDLELLRQAAFPLAPANASAVVRDYVKSRGGFVSNSSGHEGIVEILDIILCRMADKAPALTVPGPRLPIEETEMFRPSKRAYLDFLFSRISKASNKPCQKYLANLAVQLRAGEKIVIEVRMRDWGGEIKPLKAVLRAVIPLLPHARWRLIFRAERLGVENLISFNAITNRLHEFVLLPDGSQRFSAPGVPKSPPESGRPFVSLWLYDHPDDLAPWYESVIPRLVSRHPARPRTWFLNPMYLKIGGACDTLPCKTENFVKNELIKTYISHGACVMMAANLIGPADIRIAVKGFERLRALGFVDALIMAPRVVTNPARNRRMLDAVHSIGEQPVYLSQWKKTGSKSGHVPRILFVDTYGDLRHLYRACRLTYLGGGFNSRKRGFDPVESLAAGVPAIMGSICDYNRIAVDALSGTGWITIIKDAETSVDDFVHAAVQILNPPPDLKILEKFMAAHKADPYHAAAVIMADMAAEMNGDTCMKEKETKERKINISQVLSIIREFPS